MLSDLSDLPRLKKADYKGGYKCEAQWEAGRQELVDDSNTDRTTTKLQYTQPSAFVDWIVKILISLKWLQRSTQHDVPSNFTEA